MVVPPILLYMYTYTLHSQEVCKEKKKYSVDCNENRQHNGFVGTLTFMRFMLL